MGAPLYDITIYYNGNIIKDAPEDLDFRHTVNYIADFYHDRLNGYKPANTGRICINLGPTKKMDKPNYFGAICSYDNVIDENKYLSLSKKEKYKYILDILHWTVLEIANFYNWDKSFFDNAYEHIIKSDFKFEKYYPEKKSKDGKHIGHVILVKSEEKTTLFVSIMTGNTIIKEVLLEKRNWYWFDSTYNFAKSCKWLDKSSFGLCKNGQNCYFSTDQKKIVSDLKFNENDL